MLSEAVSQTACFCTYPMPKSSASVSDSQINLLCSGIPGWKPNNRAQEWVPPTKKKTHDSIDQTNKR